MGKGKFRTLWILMKSRIYNYNKLPCYMIQDAILLCAQKLCKSAWITRHTQQLKVEKEKQISSEVSVNSPGSSWSLSWRRKGRLRWEGLAEKEGFWAWNERVMCIILVNIEAVDSWKSKMAVAAIVENCNISATVWPITWNLACWCRIVCSSHWPLTVSEFWN